MKARQFLAPLIPQPPLRTHHDPQIRERPCARSAAKQGGIGVVIQPNNEGQMVIVRLVPNGPADLSGKVRPGDLLVSVDGMQVQVSCETCAVLSVECLQVEVDSAHRLAHCRPA